MSRRRPRSSEQIRVTPGPIEIQPVRALVSSQQDLVSELLPGIAAMRGEIVVPVRHKSCGDDLGTIRRREVDGATWFHTLSVALVLYDADTRGEVAIPCRRCAKSASTTVEQMEMFVDSGKVSPFRI